MPSTPAVLRPSRLALAALVLVALAALGGRGCVRGAIAARLRHAAAARGMVASWRSLAVAFPMRVALRGLTVTRAARGDTVFSAESLAVTLEPFHLLLLRATPSAVTLAHARLVRPAPPAADTLADEDEDARRHGGRDRSDRVRHLADTAVQALLAPARQLPRLTLRDVTIENAPLAGDDAREGARTGLVLDSLDLSPEAGGVSLAAGGTLRSRTDVPFTLRLHYGDDDRLAGGAHLGIADPATGRLEPLDLAVAGVVTQDRRAGTVRVADSTRVSVGTLPLFVSATLTRRGPALSLRLSADDISEARLFASLPRPVLGPLLDVAVRGSFDYRLAFDLDLARPDDVDFHTEVVPHALVLDAARTRLGLLALAGPFTATIHLPHGRLVTRELSDANPHFLPLARIDSTLVHAVVANEDGGFYHHRGFNTEAVKLAIAGNIHAGAYRRGAGTITMQLARNLWLGHERTLSRKGQEVVLAWVLEHLTGLGKQRLLEIYLNIIEWGPDVHGADEAARYYFGHGAEHVTPDEALFLTTVVPAPTKWLYRFEKDGTLRSFERAQMHFIGRAMIAKGWLDPAALPPADSLRVTLAGPARAVLFPPDTSGAAPDSLAAPDGVTAVR